VSDTPRTDECIVVYPEENAHDMYVWADFARKLERENAALLKDKERLDWLLKDDVMRFGFVYHDRDSIDAGRKAEQP